MILQVIARRTLFYLNYRAFNSIVVQVRHEMIILCNSTLQRDFIIMSEIIKINIVRFAERHSDFSNCVYVTKTFGSDERKHRENACVLKRFP